MDKAAAGRLGAQATWEKKREAKQRQTEEAVAEVEDEFLGDPISSISHLLLLLHSHRLGGYARESIAHELDRYLEPHYSANKDTVAQERHARLQELYSRNYAGARHNGHFLI